MNRRSHKPLQAPPGYWTGGSQRRDCVLITGGCGFIGTNVADRLLSSGQRVLLYDNLSRAGVERNLEWLRRRHGDAVELQADDVRNGEALRRAVARATQVYHFAAQVAVTTSLVDPVEDFSVNARGTLNLLEAIRAQATPPSLLFTSTNKVYGALPDVKLRVRGGRYEPVDSRLRSSGIGEGRPLDFHSPYGCSKGAADQYVLDYARTYRIAAVVFRMSCIYGPHQCGNEDQGWVAHFLIKALRGEPITIFGDGRQVRDILYVEDLVDAMTAAQTQIGRIGGQAFNIGGGPGATISLLDLLEVLQRLHQRKTDVRFSAWRPGDQRYYVSDTSRMQRATGWRPRVSAERGIGLLNHWLREQMNRVTAASPAAKEVV